MPNPDYWLKNDFISNVEAESLLSTLQDQITWRQDQIQMFGKKINIPRLQAFMGDQGIEYTYSKLTLNALAWHPAVINIRDKIKNLTEHPFNAVLLNYYRDGDDSMGWHQDNEPELGENPIIASVSLGAERTFLLRNKTDKKRKVELTLESGSLLWMGPSLQHQWQHSLPKTKGCHTPRINLTFRYIHPKL